MKYVLLFLIPFLACSQSLPVSESNAYVYNRYNYGNDLLNTFTLFPSKDGSVVCNPYSEQYYKISNTTIDPAIHTSEPVNFNLFGYIEFKGVQYFCGSQKIVTAKNKKKLKEYVLHTGDGEASGFGLYKQKIYFIDLYRNQVQYLKTFDGKKIETLFRFPDTSFEIRISDRLYCISYKNKILSIYVMQNKKLALLKKHPITLQDFAVRNFQNENNFCVISSNGKVIQIIDGKKISVNFSDPLNLLNLFQQKYIATKGIHKTVFPLPIGNSVFNTTLGENINNVVYNSASNSYYCGTGTQFLRIFPHIRKYPRLFNGTNSNSVFTLQQSSDGKIWAGSYQGFLSIIDGDKVSESHVKTFQWMNGGLAYRNKMILLPEVDKGVFMFEDNNHYKKIADTVTGFYLHESKDRTIYMGTSKRGLWYKKAEDLESIHKKWNKVTMKQGVGLSNILTICEDKFGNVWMGQRGLAVYNPETGKGKTWLTIKKETDYASKTMLKDNRHTLWIGTMNGKLIYYNGKSKTDYDLKNMVELRHPLFETGKTISFMHQWGEYLILGVQDKILLFDLGQWYRHQSIRVRYLNPMETALTNNTEQNTCLTDKRDGKIWFATTDMVYQWDIKKWLSLPMYKVCPQIIIKKDNSETSFSPDQTINFKPRENSIDIKIDYQTPDNMPRYLNGILVKKDDKPVFGPPSLENQFHFGNLSSGDYVFYIRVCQQDGSYDIFQYSVIISSFLWQKWWFWLFVSLFPLGFVYYYFENKRRIIRQQKLITQLNLNSLSNQFRPHFMLNALNSLGSELEDKPHANKVISRLGESINMLFKFTQSKGFTHPFQYEMQMVKNSIEIQKLLYIAELEVKITGEDIITEGMPVPMGLLQIPVENALLHGLRNKESGSYLLEIDIKKEPEYYCITIKDNGVGRESATRFNHYKKNGWGLKNIRTMIDLINSKEKDSITFEITDLLNPTETLVTITIKQNIDDDRLRI